MKHFEELSKINVNDKVEKKNGLTYLSWMYAWSEVKKVFPEANYNIIKFDGLPYVFDEKTGYMVFTNMTIEGITHEMWLPVMDGANKAMRKEPYQYKSKFGERTCNAADMFDINKTLMRCLVKNMAMFGLGGYIYASEYLPEQEHVEGIPADIKPKAPPTSKTSAKVTVKTTTKERIEKLCEFHKLSIKDFGLLLKVLQDEGKVADKPTAEMNSVEVDTMLREMDTIRGQTSVGAN